MSDPTKIQFTAFVDDIDVKKRLGSPPRASGGTDEEHLNSIVAMKCFDVREWIMQSTFADKAFVIRNFHPVWECAAVYLKTIPSSRAKEVV